MLGSATSLYTRKESLKNESSAIIIQQTPFSLVLQRLLPLHWYSLKLTAHCPECFGWGNWSMLGCCQKCHWCVCKVRSNTQTSLHVPFLTVTPPMHVLSRISFSCTVGKLLQPAPTPMHVSRSRFFSLGWGLSCSYSYLNPFEVPSPVPFHALRVNFPQQSPTPMHVSRSRFSSRIVCCDFSTVPTPMHLFRSRFFFMQVHTFFKVVSLAHAHFQASSLVHALRKLYFF